MPDVLTTVEAIGRLCLSCGLCCNGVLFKDVELQPGDAAWLLRGLGRALGPGCEKSPAGVNGPAPRPVGRSESRPETGLLKFPQPCRALGEDTRCRIYQDRPLRCREFECALFKSVVSGKLSVALARRTIGAALEQGGRVGELLRKLGDTEESLALSRRFQRMQKQIHRRELTEEAAALYGQLTLAVHDLNRLLQQEFYP
jgi:uncharacterized protein